MSDRAPYDMSFFADDDNAGVHFDDFINALSVWAWMRPGNGCPTVGEAADAFGVAHDVICNAVNVHPWMFLTGLDDDRAQQRIEHEGE